jgi:hypothetical protein
VFVTVSHLHPSLVLASKAGAYSSGALNEFHSKGRLLAFLANNRLEWKALTVEKNLNHYNMEIITVVKKFNIQAPGVYWLK